MDVASYAIELDVQLMQRVRDGDAQSFAVLLERHRVPVIHFLYRMVQNQAIAEELAQEVFLRVYRSRLSYEPTAKFTTWLFRISTHLALNWLRDNKCEGSNESITLECDEKAYRELPDRTPNVEENLLKNSRAREIRIAISELPGKQKAAVLMHKYQEMDYFQISSVLGCTESAVKSLLFRAYERLRGRLAHLHRNRT